jgi:predicted O-linked N-acetylglucosamine transferase (SPINDLY family)
MTSLESLWMGVPVITLEQPLLAGRQTLSMLHNVGMEDCIAADREAYAGIAARLASDMTQLAARRAALRERMRASPLLDYAGFTRDLEAAYRSMWRAFVATSQG